MQHGPRKPGTDARADPSMGTSEEVSTLEETPTLISVSQKGRSLSKRSPTTGSRLSGIRSRSVPNCSSR
jgi:hypothetical protein